LLSAVGRRNPSREEAGSSSSGWCGRVEFEPVNGRGRGSGGLHVDIVQLEEIDPVLRITGTRYDLERAAALRTAIDEALRLVR
jgi:hypothetical protein